jgi:hypothetical protein
MRAEPRSKSVVSASAAALAEAQGFPSLTEHQEAQLAVLERKLQEKPEPAIVPNAREARKPRLIRWLRSSAFNVEQTFQMLHQHCKWWADFGMDDFTSADELDQHAPLFVCGHDRWQRPVLVARPCVHLSTNHQESIRAAKRCVYTFQRCVERMPYGVEKATVIYDAKGIQVANLDIAFVRELIPAIGNHFPGRFTRILVINNHWTMAFFWRAISALLDPVTKSKIIFCGTDFKESLLQFVEEDHEYLQYALAVQALPPHEGALLPLPKASLYVPHWQDFLVNDAKVEDSEGEVSTEASKIGIRASVDDWSRQTTAASSTMSCMDYVSKRAPSIVSIDMFASDDDWSCEADSASTLSACAEGDMPTVVSL